MIWGRRYEKAGFIGRLASLEEQTLTERGGASEFARLSAYRLQGPGHSMVLDLNAVRTPGKTEGFAAGKL